MFYIKRIILHTGENDAISTVELGPGLNIIYGESNTGKSLIRDCIDYLTGASTHRFDSKLKINKISMVLNVDGYNLTISRKLDSNNVDVAGNVPFIENGQYKAKNGGVNTSLNTVWLQLMGIEPDTKIIQTISGKPQRFTIRTIAHTFLYEETKLQASSSMFSKSPDQKNQIDTNVLTSYMYLATGNNFLPDESAKDPKIKKAKSEAVHKFVDRSMQKLEDTKLSELKDLSTETPTELQKKIDETIDSIGAAEGALENASNAAQEIAEKIIKADNQISESRVLMNRNKALLSQYESDIKRLTFIAEGDIEHSKLPKLTVCPFCNGELTKDQSESCVDAAIAEVNKIEAQIKDLRSVQDSIEQEIKELQQQRSGYLSERKTIDSRIRMELKPQIADLRTNLANYTIALNQYKAKELIDTFSDVLIKEMEVSDNEDSTEFHFEVRDKFAEVFQREIDAELKTILTDTNYHNLISVYFDKTECDIVVNGHPKKTQGKGYRAFLNTITLIAFQNCLEKLNHFALPFLVVDSPILSLMEKEDNDQELVTDTMKVGLFSYLVKHPWKHQILVIENRIPNLDYGNTNLIEFTKDENRGRYGLINGYRDN